MNNSCDVLIIGSGPAGLAAAKQAASGGKKVYVLEKNSVLAKKLYATGNGRCNYMNTNMEDSAQLLSFGKEIGLIPSVDEEGRVYPRNHQAASVVNILTYGAGSDGVVFFTETEVTDVLKNEQEFIVKSNKGDFSCSKLLIATGGKAGIQFGCTGEGYKWARKFGHTVRKPIPALTGFECAQDTALLNGVRVYAGVSLLCNGKEIARDEGEVQFSRNGISGICVMNLSRYFRISEDCRYELKLDLYPEYSGEGLVDLFNHQIKTAGCAMEGLVPEKIHDYLHSIIKPEEHNPDAMSIVSKNLIFTITGSRGWKDAQVTCGGVLLEEVDENYQSKLEKNLFFAGEILDYDGPCGGYNIGFALRSGITAGKAMSV